LKIFSVTILSFQGFQGFPLKIFKVFQGHSVWFLVFQGFQGSAGTLFLFCTRPGKFIATYRSAFRTDRITKAVLLRIRCVDRGLDQT